MNKGDSSAYVSAGAVRERNAALGRYEAWERDHPSNLDPATAIRAVGFLYDLLPREARCRDDDPRFEGVHRMKEALAVLKPRRG